MYRHVLRAPSTYRHLLSKRRLSLQEFHSKQLLDRNGCTVQEFFVVDSDANAEKEFSKHDYKEYAVKSQLLAGGRGKGRFINGPPDLGGVHITDKKDDALKATKQMLGKRLVTKQTPPNGVLVRKVLVANSIPIHRETYLAILLDRQSNGPVIVASSAGGVDIEETAETNPDLIIKEPVDIHTGITDEQCLRVASALKFEGKLRERAAKEIRQLYELFVKIDASQIEINPFVESSEDRVFCVDAKINLDENAKFRQREIFEVADQNSEVENVREEQAHKCGLNYIGLDGDIACMVNGAGLAMATMDIIKLHGGEPANFLDVGGSVTEKQVLEAFQILTSDEQNVNAVLVNIFGGIVNCALIAKGILGAVEKANLRVPLVVRLEGTNAAEGRDLLSKSGLKLYSSTDFDKAANKVVELAQEFKSKR